MSNSIWQDIQRLSDDIRLQVHLARMETRERWREVEPRITRLETRMKASTDRIEEGVARELDEVRSTLLHVRDDVYGRARSSFARGW